jgi:hypothetical protein
MASDIGRRPKGVVAIPVSISSFAFQSGKRNLLTEPAPGLLTAIRGFAIL